MENIQQCMKCGQFGFAAADHLCWACRKAEDEARASRPVPPAVQDERQQQLFA